MSHTFADGTLAVETVSAAATPLFAHSPSSSTSSPLPLLQRPHSAGSVSVPLFGYGADYSMLLAAAAAAAATNTSSGSSSGNAEHERKDRMGKGGNGSGDGGVVVSSPKRRSRQELYALQRSLAALMDPFQTYFRDQRKHCANQEAQCRVALERLLLEEQEEWMRVSLLEEEQNICRAEMVRQRREEAWSPWCNQHCRYCCVTRLARERDVRKTHQGLRDMLIEQEAIVRRVLAESIEQQMVAVFHSERYVGQTVLLLTAQRETLEAEYAHYGLILSQMQRKGFDAIYEQKEEILGNWTRQQQLSSVREQRRENERERERLMAVQRKQERQMEFFICEREREARHLLSLQEVAFRREIRARMVDEAAQITSATWRRDMQHVFEELDALRLFKEQTLSAARDAETARALETQASLEREFAELKKMKKQGPPKQPILPPCSRCGEVPAKDDFTHRLQECPERPIQCLKCSFVHPLSTQDAHKLICPSRVLQCPTCQNHYKASYLETVHLMKCQMIQTFHAQLPRIGATFPWVLAETKYRMCMVGPSSAMQGDGDEEVEQSMAPWEDRVEGTPVRLRPGSNKKVPDGVVVGLLEINGKSARTMAELDSIFPESRTLVVGEKWNVLLSLPGSLMQQRGGGGGGGGRSPSARSPSLAALQSGSPHGSVTFNLEPSSSSAGFMAPAAAAAGGPSPIKSFATKSQLNTNTTTTSGGSRSPAVTPRRSLGANVAVSNDATVELQAVPDGVSEEQYQEMVLLTNSDIGQYCKPQLEKKRGGSAKAR